LNTFQELGLSSKVLEVLDKLGFENPTPIQQKAIPILLAEKSDFIGLAQTGTGKTAAFGLPLIDRVDLDNHKTQAIIMAPTRELGQQTAKQLVEFTQNNAALNIEVVYGGANISNQIKALKKPTQIVVATPGRLLDLIKRKAIRLADVKYVVLDEADEMLNMGFKEDIDSILSHTSDQRNIWLFSATMPSDIRKIVNKYMSNPQEVAVNTKQQSNEDITHQYVVTKTNNKLAAVRRFLDIQPEMRGVMFCRTKRDTQSIADELSAKGYGVEALHGDLSQGQRDAVMRRFKSKSMQLLVATDVAARGIDVDDLTHVMHHMLPDQLESYTHRSGRTGRAGKKGISLAFINPREGRKIKELEKKIKIKFDKVDIPTSDKLKSSRIHHWAEIISNTNVDPDADALLEEVKEYFDSLDRDAILKRLITTQLDHISQGEADHDLNEEQNFKDQKSKGGNQKGPSRYFINVGTMDGVTPGDLVHYISDVSGLKRSHLKNLSMQKSCTFFDVEDGFDKDLSKAFEGEVIEGRSIRVNRDDEGPKKSQGSGGKKKHNRNRNHSKNRGGRRDRGRRR